MKQILLRSAAAILLLTLCACSDDGYNSGGSGGSSSSSSSSSGGSKQLEFEFDSDASGWRTGFADYPAGSEIFYELESGFEQLPPPLENLSGLNVSGNNHSDDLFMFVKKEITGLDPNTQYSLSFEITFATNAPSGCFGVGGSPGESVFIKAGASVVEPLPVEDRSGYYLMNIDIGDQDISGNDAIAIGNFANSKDCEDNNFSYELKTVNSGGNPFSVFTGADGGLWLLFSTDSGFEGTTSIYYVSGSVIAVKI